MVRKPLAAAVWAMPLPMVPAPQMQMVWIMSLYLHSPGKLPEESYVILRGQPEVVDPVFQLTDTFNTHTECEAGVFVGVDAEVLQHFRMDHAAAQDLNPSRMFTNVAAAASADTTVDVHF